MPNFKSDPELRLFTLEMLRESRRWFTVPVEEFEAKRFEIIKSIDKRIADLEREGGRDHGSLQEDRS